MTEWRVSGYTEVRELGAGAQGRVVLARNDASGAPVAVKYLAPAADEAERERMRHEARMLAQADSPHIARLYGMVESDTGAALVMEAVDGVSLKAVLERHGALGPEAALTVLKGSLLGLAAAHALGVVHRDFKPANIVVPADGRSRLVDFGIAVPAGRVAGGAGTPLYMAPEQWTEHTATPATDVYAATCVFVEAVTGRRPYSGSGDELRAAHLTAPVPVADVPEPLRPLVLAGMAKTPDARPPGAAVFVEELETVARAAYGDDWEGRGAQMLAFATVALAALFPLAAWTVPAGTAASAAGSSAGAVSLGGKAAAAGGAKGFLGSGAGMAGIAAGTAAVVVGGAVIAQQFVPDDPPPRPAVSASPVAATVAPIGCKPSGPGPSQAAPPATLTLPARIRLPEGAAVYYGGDQFMIGPAGRECLSSAGAASGTHDVGTPATGFVSRSWQGSVGTIAGMMCEYFPDSPEAARVRRDRGDCTSSTPRTALPAGAKGVRAVLVPGDIADAGPPPPRVSVRLVTVSDNGAPTSTTCSMPWAKRDLCTAALGYAYLLHAEGTATPAATLDAALARIGTYVTASRTGAGAPANPYAGRRVEGVFLPGLKFAPARFVAVKDDPGNYTVRRKGTYVPVALAPGFKAGYVTLGEGPNGVGLVRRPMTVARFQAHLSRVRDRNGLVTGTNPWIVRFDAAGRVLSADHDASPSL
ncbi:serine/threonine-protein kinase [Actinomadura flavalba]|uniref:serine/threonine-protein kinase n=1 Tax=Actinomadura flavalba TaxID=1120938 RepID=UPI0003A329AB|nr:serine/threonine-protein kinase [Actinomadura flavalba]